MDSINPYSPPRVAQTAYRPTSETLFHYHHSTRNWRSIVVVIPIAFIMASALSQLLYATTQNIPRPTEQSFAMMAMAAVLFFVLVTSMVSVFVWPRIHELRVDRDVVWWRTPWPSAIERHVSVSQIDRVEYVGHEITIVTSEGNHLKPSSTSHGRQAAAVVEAIAAAVTEREPRTRVQRRTAPETSPMMRSLGRCIGYCIYYLKKLLRFGK